MRTRLRRTGVKCRKESRQVREDVVRTPHESRGPPTLSSTLTQTNVSRSPSVVGTSVLYRELYLTVGPPGRRSGSLFTLRELTENLFNDPNQFQPVLRSVLEGTGKGSTQVPSSS